MKYKTWEVIKMITENPKLKFHSIPFVNEKDAHIYVNSSNDVIWNGGGLTGKPLAVSTDVEWELIQEPVTFMEAVKAYSEGKTIRCEYNNETLTFTSDCKHWDGYQFIPVEKCAIGTDSILSGKWYIE